MTKGLKKIRLVLVAVGLCLTLLLTVAIPVCEAGPDERVVKIGWHGIWTGPLAATGGPCGDAIMAYTKWLNERGGIVDGVKLEVMWYETRGTVPGMISAHKRFVEAGAVGEISILETGVEAILRSLVRDEMTHLLGTGYSTREVTRPVPWVFTAEPSSGDSGAVILKWFRDNWTEERRPKVGALLYDSAATWEWLAGVKWACEQWDMEFVGHEVVPLAGCIDTSTEWLRLASKEIDCACVATCGATQVVTIKDAFRLEIQKRGIKFLELGYCIADNLDIVGAEADGWYFPLYLPFTWEQAQEIPGVKLAYELAGKKEGETISSAYMAGVYYIPLYVEGIRLAIEKVGLENLTGRAVREALFSIKDLDIGLGTPPITMTEVEPWFSPGVLLYEVRQGRAHRISDWINYPGYYKTLHFYE